MEFRNLYSFLRVAELGSFTKAAAELGYAQSTITAHIQQLEQELERPLFEHIGRRVILTAYGNQLVPYVNQILCLQEEIQSLNQTDSTQVYGSICIGIVESIMYSILLENIEEYRARYPHVDMKIERAFSAPLYERLRSGALDLIFTLGDQKELPGFIHAGGYATRAVFFAAPDHPLAGRKDLTLSDVLSQPLALTGSETFIRRALDQAAFERGLEVRPFVETHSNGFIFSLVRRKMGVSFLPEYRIQKAMLEHEVTILPVPDFGLSFYVNIYYRKNKFVTPQMAGLIQLVQEYWNRVSAENDGESTEEET